MMFLRKGSGLAVAMGIFVAFSMAHAASGTELQTSPCATFVDIVNEEAAELHIASEDVVQVSVQLSPARGTHLAITYTSAKPVRIAVASFPAGLDQTVDMFRSAVLPRAASGTVFFPLMQSAWWTGGKQPVMMTVFADRADRPIFNLQIVDRASAPQRFWYTFLQPWRQEILSITAVNYLKGYRMRSLPFHALVALIGLCAGVLVWAVRRKGLRDAFLIAAIFIGFYQVRFLTDIVRHTVDDFREWHERGTYGQMRDLYAVAEDVLARRSTGAVSVSLCGDLTTPLKYLVHPVPVVSRERATYAILMHPWSEDRGTVQCGGADQRGEILKLFPDGAAVMRVLPQP